MEENLFRTYRRRVVTRKSGYKASGIKSGGECIILNSDAVVMKSEVATLKFETTNIHLENLFEMDLGIIAFGGYIKPSAPISLELELTYQLENGTTINHSRKLDKEIKTRTWNGIGLHVEQQIDASMNPLIEKANVLLKICGPVGTELSFISVDFNSISYRDYLSNKFYEPFSQKTSMHIPHIYYLSTEKNLDTYLIAGKGIEDTIYQGEPVVLKGCNRCARYLPINIIKEEDTLAFSLHCKKKAPCKHPLFSSYKIDNYDDIVETDDQDKLGNIITGHRVTSYYGHQLECRACKKFYVNYALNPLRNAQQFKEDGLRRRALEILVNSLLESNLIHQEFEHRTKKQFTEYIWRKFGKRCFKCGKKLKINEMHLDHTMPLAYLYRLDETATCLCSIHNSQKRDSFPVDYYSEPEKLQELSDITGLPMNVLSSRGPNPIVLKLLIENIEWFFDDFLMKDEYQKDREGIVTADKIYASLERILKGTGIDLLKEYQLKTDRNPSSIKVF